MGTPHKHAEAIKAWAEGAEIEVSYPQSGQKEIVWSAWETCSHPRWYEEIRYRIKPAPHKYQELIDAFRSGATDIQIKCEDGSWKTLDDRLSRYSWEVPKDAELRRAHKWQKEIDAYNAGENIQFRLRNSITLKEWQDCPRPAWLTTSDAEYRVKPHKWQKEMEAYAQGKTVQFRNKRFSSLWHDCPKENIWHTLGDIEYRIKPVETENFYYFENSLMMKRSRTQSPNLKLTFEDGKLVKAEVL